MRVFVLSYGDKVVNHLSAADYEVISISIQSGVLESVSKNVQFSDLDVFITDFTLAEPQKLQKECKNIILKAVNTAPKSLHYMVYSEITNLQMKCAYENGIHRTFELNSELQEMIPSIAADYEKRNREKANQFTEQRKLEKMQKKLERDSIRNSFISRNQLEDAREIVRRLRNNFGNDSGIGAMITASDVLGITANQTDGGTLVDSHLFQGMLDSARAAGATLNAMNLFLNLTEKKPQLSALYIEDLAGIVDNVVRAVKPVCEKQEVSLLYEKEEGFPREIVLCDKSIIQTIYTELIVNALKFSHAGDSVQILPVFKKDSAGLMVLNSAYELKDGIQGIPPEYEEKVFEPFYRMKESSNDAYRQFEIMTGLGLGLTLVKRLVDFHGGDITIGNIESHSLSEFSVKTRVIAEVSVPLK